MVDMSDIYDAIMYVDRAQKAKRGGPPKLTHCQRGHDMAVYGVVLKRKLNKYGVEVSNGRACSLCKKDRDREAYERKKARGAATRAAQAGQSGSSDRA